MKNVLSFEAFADWCEAQGDQQYNWDSVCNCACAQYAKHLGAYEVWSEIAHDNFRGKGFWYEANKAAYVVAGGARHGSFSKLAAYLRAA